MEKKEWVITDLITGAQIETDAYWVRTALETLYDTSDDTAAQCIEALAAHAERGIEIPGGTTEYLNVTIEQL